MIASHLDFRKPSEPTGSPGLIQLTQNQIQKLFRSLFTTEHFHHPGPPLHLLGEPFQLVRGGEVAADGLRMTQERQESIGFGLPPLHDLGIDRAPPLPQAPQGFFGLLPDLGPVDLLEILSQRVSVLLLALVQSVPDRVQNTELPIRLREDLLDRLL
jgi:hypothetical protein